MRTEHRKHDRVLVTRFAMDDAYPSERDEARLQIENCPDCAALAADIRHLSNAVGQVPVPARTRDFAISAEKADELRGNRLTRWMRTFATPRWGTLRPVAGVALSIGLVMAVVGTALPSTLPAFDSSGGAPVGETSDRNGAQAGQTQAPPPAPLETPMPELNAPGAEENPAAPATDGLSVYLQASEAPVSQDVNKAYTDASPVPGTGGTPAQLAVTEPRDTSRDLLTWVGLAIAAISVGLLALAFVARRYFADPLLR